MASPAQTPEKKPFWRIPVPKIPGSIKPLNEASGTAAAKSPTSPVMKSPPRALSGEDEESRAGEMTGKSNSSGLFAGLNQLIEDGVLPDIPDTTLEQKLHSLSVEDNKTEESNDVKQTMKLRKFMKLYQAPNVDLDELRQLSWSGIPATFRSWAWKLLMGYMPLNKDRRQATMDRKRREYLDCVEQYFGVQNDAGEYSNVDASIFHQIQIDVPRTNPDVKLYLSPITRKCLERVLYVWTIRHPASGYVQGINDLMTPFFSVFLSQYIDGDPDLCDIAAVEKDVLDIVEADSYWCLSKLIDGIQDSFTTSQPGIQRQVYKLKELVARIDAPLLDHFQNQGIEFLQFSFRWMNCLLMRETSLRNIIRMWDTYMAEGVDGYSIFHLYVCAAFLISWAKDIKKMDFAELMTFLQSPPSLKWGAKEVDVALSEAFMWKSLFQNAQSHLH